MVILGNPTLTLLLGIEVYDSLGERVRERAARTGVDTTAYRQCRRVTVSVDALRQQTSLTPEESVERLVARGPDIDMNPEVELRARSEELEDAVQASAAAGLSGASSKDHWQALECVSAWVMKGWSARTCGALARPVKVRLRVYNPIKTAYLAACMALLAALGIAFPNLQALLDYLEAPRPVTAGELMQFL